MLKILLIICKSESLKKNILKLLSKDKKASDIYQKDYDNWSFNYYKNIKSKSLRNQNINNIKYYEPKLKEANDKANDFN